MPMGQYLGVFFTNGVVIGCIYALIALGFNVIYSTTGIINFAQGEFVMIGGISCAWAIESLKLPIALAVAFAILVTALVGLLSYLIAIRPAKGATPVTYIIITIAISIVLKCAASFAFAVKQYSVPKFIGGVVPIGGGQVDRHSLLVIPVVAVCMIALLGFFKHTRAGRNMKACAESREGARLCGISVESASARSFALGAGLAGVGGVLITSMYSMQFDGGTMIGLKGFSAAILGGLGSPAGCVLGGLMMGLIEQGVKLQSPEYADIIALALVIGMLLIRPRGLVAR
jgi:branched-chain amino acid transport system permease protein